MVLSVQSMPKLFREGHWGKTEITEAKAFRTFIRIYPLFENMRLCATIILTLHKAWIRLVMYYACPA
jgi:hypothetical protein